MLQTVTQRETRVKRDFEIDNSRSSCRLVWWFPWTYFSLDFGWGSRFTGEPGRDRELSQCFLLCGKELP